MNCKRFLSLLLVFAVFSLGRAQITIDIIVQIQGWPNPTENGSIPADIVEFCLQPQQPPQPGNNNCQHGMYQVERDDTQSDHGEGISMVFYSPGTLATKLQLLFKAYSSNRTFLDDEVFRLNATDTSPNTQTATDVDGVGMVTLTYTKSFSDCIDDSGLGADLSNYLQKTVGILATLLALCLILCLLLVVIALTICQKRIFGAGMFQRKERNQMDIEEQSPFSNYERYPADKMGSMLSLGTPSAYSYPRIDVIERPPASSADGITLSKPPVPKRIVSTPATTAATIPAPIVTVPKLEVAKPTETATLSVEMDTQATSAKGNIIPLTFKQKKKDRKEKKGKKMKPVVQSTTRYDSNPAYNTISREQEGEL